MSGHVLNPGYQQVCFEHIGHSETVEVVYDTRKLTTQRLLTELFPLHDFTQYRQAG
jgi:peptide methionine sulfoxide reductase msrA/msrB